MKLVTFNGHRLGLLSGQTLQDVTDWAFENCADRIRDPLIAFIHAQAVGGVPTGVTVPLSEATFGPPILFPGKIIAAAANYLKHTQEMNPGVQADSLVHTRQRGFFLKAPSSIIGPDDAVILPYADRRTDQEAELAVIIGRGGKDISEEDALNHVFGYACLLDISLRGKEDRGLRKSFDTFTPIGPWITTADEIANPDALDLKCTVNGEVRQHDSTGAMVIGVRQLISWMSSVMTLHPGDIIATGTPAGVGPLNVGDRIEVEIEGLGKLCVDVKSKQ
jgi:2-keto-4-pentenoate hydratase/2-oxohepta-3-ene-1,7-dioic acid hydratase in catechol pathway